MPAALQRNTAAIGPFVPVQGQKAAIGRQVGAPGTRFRDVVNFREGNDKGDFAGVVVLAKTLKMVTRQLGIVVPLKSLQIEAGGQGLVIRLIEAVAAEVGIVAGILQLVLCAPDGIDIVIPLQQKVTAVLRAAAAVGAVGPGDAAFGLDFSVRQSPAVDRRQHRRFIAVDDGGEGEVFRRVDGPEIGYSNRQSQVAVGTIKRNQQPRAAFDRRPRMRHVGKIRNGNSEHLKNRILVLDFLADVVMDDPDRLDPP